MFDEHRTLAEMSATLDVPGGLLPGVYSLVLVKSCTVIGTFLTAHTLVGILATVDSPVGAELRTVGEAPPSLSALVGLLSSVGSLVHNETRALAEAFPTLSTLCRASLLCEFSGGHQSWRSP
ncbi:hypothetical protein FD754_002703 [Muntiacus muntjak]|uniref:Uncharacterized protein n=1 Tax=Muntiacus muntjak TaxID=9888 RepID=A0A5N3WBP7_MUNMU|nr:hypothetical protein FD754_002703 [Muntiacus muntjak]